MNKETYNSNEMVNALVVRFSTREAYRALITPEEIANVFAVGGLANMDRPVKIGFRGNPLGEGAKVEFDDVWVLLAKGK